MTTVRFLTPATAELEAAGLLAPKAGLIVGEPVRVTAAEKETDHYLVTAFDSI